MTQHTSRRVLLSAAAATVLGAGTAACSLLEDTGPAANGPAAVAEPIDGSSTLVAYLSVPETDDPDDMTQDQENSSHVVDGRVLGNVQHLAQVIAARTGAEIFRIDTAEPLPLDHDTLEELALGWQEADERPPLKELVTDMADYDTVFIGYPIWWYDLPMPVHSFLDEHDLSGKTVVLFSVHGGSRLSGTDETITTRLSESTVVSNALTISRDDMDDAQETTLAWLDEVVSV